MADADDLYLENLDEFVNDQNRIVTIKWLSNSLKVSSNKSKEMLKNFVDEECKNNNQLTVTYLIGGTIFFEENQLGYKYVIVREDNVKETKEKFENVTCCHIYSIQKSSLKNQEMLSNIDVKTSLHELSKWSGIHCPLVTRDENSFSSSRDMAPEPSISNGFGERISSTKGTDKQNDRKEQKQSLTSTKKNTTATSFFGATNNKTKDKKSATAEKQQSEKAPTEQKQEQTKKSEKDKQGLSFFGKPVKGNSSVKSKLVKESAKKASNDEAVSEKNNKGDSKKKRTESKEQEMEVDEQKTVESEVRKERSKKKTKREEENIDEENTKEAKRRKTVIHESESEEDDFESFIKSAKSKEEDEHHDAGVKSKASERLFEEEKKTEEPKVAEEKPKRKKREKQDIDQDRKKSQTTKEMKDKPQKKKKIEEKETKMEEDPVDVDLVSAEESKNPDDKPKEKRRIRKKVLRSKTFMNDEGYMVTEKVYESESATEESENESESVNKKPDLAHRKPKDITEGNKKLKIEASKHKTQASLMSFFKKK